MTIWILALLLFGLVPVAGYNMGAVRAAISTFGLLFAALLAKPLSGLVMLGFKPLFSVFGVKNPFFLWTIGPVITFILVLATFKMIAMAVHRQVEVYYKYKAGDLRLALWERLNARVGACIGTINALIYLVVITVVIYVMGYWTTQLSQGEGDSRSVAWVTRLARDLHSSGLEKVARSYAPMNDDYYTAADIMGIVYHNPLATSRLSHYPSLLGLTQRAEFNEIATDTGYFEMLQRQSPVQEILGHPKTRAIWNNPDLLKEIWGIAQPDLKDLHEFVLTGKTAKYTEPILGRWTIDAAASFAELRKARPNMGAIESKALLKIVTFGYTKGVFIATPNHQAFLKEIIWVKPAAKSSDVTTSPSDRTAEWQPDGLDYKLPFSEKEMVAKVDGNRLKLTGEWLPLVFNKEE